MTLYRDGEFLACFEFDKHFIELDRRDPDGHFDNFGVDDTGEKVTLFGPDYFRII